MSKEVKAYCQCTMERKIEGGTQHTTSWIPQTYANVGEALKLRGEDGVWVDGWVVKFVSLPLPAKTVEANARNYLKQRKASDVIFSEIKKQNER